MTVIREKARVPLEGNDPHAEREERLDALARLFRLGDAQDEALPQHRAGVIRRRLSSSDSKLSSDCMKTSRDAVAPDGAVLDAEAIVRGAPGLLPRRRPEGSGPVSRLRL